jgi:hypothetical protein
MVLDYNGYLPEACIRSNKKPDLERPGEEVGCKLVISYELEETSSSWFSTWSCRAMSGAVAVGAGSTVPTGVTSVTIPKKP